MIGMDVAASEFFENGKYDLDFKSPADKKDASQVMSGKSSIQFIPVLLILN